MLKPEALVRAVKAADANALHGEKGHESDEVTGAGETRNGMKSGTHLRGSKKSIDLEVEIRNLEGNLSAPRTTIRSCLALGNLEGEKVRVVKNQGKINNGLLSMEAALVAMENHNLEVDELRSLQEGWGNLLSSGSSVARQCTFSSLSRAGYKLAPYKPREHFTSQPMQIDTDIDVGAAEILYGVALNSPVWWIEEMLLDLVDEIHGGGGSRAWRRLVILSQSVFLGSTCSQFKLMGHQSSLIIYCQLVCNNHDSKVYMYNFTYKKPTR